MPVTKAVLNSAIQQLATPAVAARLDALKKISSWGPAAAPAVPKIIDVLNENRANAASFTGNKPTSPEVTDCALRALKSIGKAAHDAAPYLTPMLKDRNELLRRPQVLEALAAIGPASDSASVIMRVAGEEGKFTAPRLIAISLLGQIDPPAAEATDFLREICEDVTDKKAQAEATKALDSILKRTSSAKAGANEADKKIRDLRAELGSGKEKEVRLEALKKTAELGAGAAPLVPMVVQTIFDHDEEIRNQAINVLSGLKGVALPAVPKLVAKVLSTRNDDERNSLSDAIISIDPSGTRTVPLLQNALQDPFQAKVAIDILQQIGTEESIAVARKARQQWHLK